MADIWMSQIEEYVTREITPTPQTKCLCGRELVGQPVYGYPHEGGQETPVGRMWLYFACECGHQFSFRHARLDFDFTKLLTED
jgi:hypothetical protein